MIKISSQYTTLWRLALPVIIAQVGQMSVQLVDTLMVGQLGAVPLAGVSFANSLMLPISIAGMGLAMGLTPLVGRATARGDFSRVQSLLKNSIVLNAAIGVFLTGLL
ncbi:MAG: MATE family efflux transporter, partial [Mucinivorans sp.]